MLSIKYAITKEDYINYYTYVMWDAPGKKKKRLIYYGKQSLPILIFLFAFYYTGLFHRPGNFILLIAGFLLITTLLSFMGVRNNTMKQAEAVADDPENGSVFLESNLLVSETGLLVKDDLKETKYQWGAIIKKLESRQYYFLFHNAMQAIIIPKRAFATAEEKIKFEKLLSQYLSLDAEVSHLLKNK